MDNAEFTALSLDLAARHERGDHEAASAMCAAIVADESVPDLDRSLMARNLATILGQSGATSDQIEAAYDRAIRLEHRWLRSYAREHKVAWLAEVGRPGDAIVILEQLIDEPWLQLADRARIDLNLEMLRAR